MNKKNYLLAVDFDGSLAATNELSPNGLNVEIASGRAIEEIFGKQGLHVYQEMGGLGNREPGELIKLIQEKIGWLNMHVDALTKHYIQIKLRELTPEISPTWPRLYPGVKDFLLAVSSGDLPFNIAVISSGHDAFIRKVFEVNDIPQPDILVSSDIIRQRKMPERERYKPHTYQLAEAHKQWTQKNEDSHEQYIGRAQGKPNMLYIGDDPNKDGGLAEQARIPFVCVPFTHETSSLNEEKGQLRIRDFSELKDLFESKASMFIRGDSFSEIIFNKKDSDLFPPIFEEGKLYKNMLDNKEKEWPHQYGKVNIK